MGILSAYPMSLKRKSRRKRKVAFRKTVRRVHRRVRSVKHVSKRKRLSAAGRRVRRKTELRVGAGDVTRSRYVFGRKPKISAWYNHKLLSCSVSKAYYIYKALTDYRANQGRILLARLATDTVYGAINSYADMPCRIFNLTALAENGSGGTSVLPDCSFVPRKYFFEANKYTYTFAATGDGFTPSGTSNTAKWSLEKGEGSSSTCQKKSVLEWLNIKMDLVGATDIPTRFTVMIGYFTDKDLCPEEAVPVAEDDSFNKRTDFWDDMFRSDITHPLNMGVPDEEGSKPGRGFNMIFKKVVMINPKSNTDQWASGDEHWVTFFKRFNKVQDFMWRDEKNEVPPNTVGRGAELAGAWYQNISGAVREIAADVDWTKRLYLIVKANNHNPSATVSTADDPKYCPSFDIIMRKKYRIGATASTI